MCVYMSATHAITAASPMLDRQGMLTTPAPGRVAVEVGPPVVLVLLRVVSVLLTLLELLEDKGLEMLAVPVA